MVISVNDLWEQTELYRMIIKAQIQ